MSSRVKVVVTGAAGQIAYSLIPRLVDGKTFGNKIVDLYLVEIPQVVSKLEGLVMELEDSYFPQMGEVKYTDILKKHLMMLIGFCLLAAFQEELSMKEKN